MPIVATSSKGQILIPSALRKKIGLKPGAKVLITSREKNSLVLQPVPDDPIESACGFLAEGPSLGQALLKEHREEQKRDQAKRARLLRPARLPRKGARIRSGPRSAA